jgi:hypothetical protein
MEIIGVSPKCFAIMASTQFSAHYGHPNAIFEVTSADID